MKILVDKMPEIPEECPFAEKSNSAEMNRRGLLRCSLGFQAPDGHRVHCVCKPAYCDFLKEVSTHEEG